MTGLHILYYEQEFDFTQLFPPQLLSFSLFLLPLSSSEL